MRFKKKEDSGFWHTGIVERGFGKGREMSYPTINIEATLLSEKIPRGVYASWIKIDGKKYMGALYYGPRKVKGENCDVLEIHILKFDQDIYGKAVEFTLDKFIREAKNFSSFEKLKKQISVDIKKVEAVLK